MNTDWIRHRAIIAAYYRSANAYAALCRRENLSSAGLNTMQIQILEQIMEHSEENRNMKWYANMLGVSSSAFTNNINHLTRQGLVEKFHTASNKKNIILKVTDSGLKAYDEYVAAIGPQFDAVFEALDKLTPEDDKAVAEAFWALGDSHMFGADLLPQEKEQLIPVKK